MLVSATAQSAVERADFFFFFFLCPLVWDEGGVADQGGVALG